MSWRNAFEVQGRLCASDARGNSSETSLALLHYISREPFSYLYCASKGSVSSPRPPCSPGSPGSPLISWLPLRYIKIAYARFARNMSLRYISSVIFWPTVQDRTWSSAIQISIREQKRETHHTTANAATHPPTNLPCSSGLVATRPIIPTSITSTHNPVFPAWNLTESHGFRSYAKAKMDSMNKTTRTVTDKSSATIQPMNKGPWNFILGATAAAMRAETNIRARTARVWRKRREMASTSIAIVLYWNFCVRATRGFFSFFCLVRVDEDDSRGGGWVL